MNNSNLTSHYLSCMLLYCDSNGIAKVIFKHNAHDQYDPETKTITINKKYSLKTQLYLLLHEFGHHCIMKDQFLVKKFYNILDRDPNNTLSEQILAIEEEILAWHFGEQAAKVLEIDLSDKYYQVLKSKCLKSHIKSYRKVIS